MFLIQLKIPLRSFRFLLKWEHRISNFVSFKCDFLLHWQECVLLWYLDSAEIVLAGSNVIKEKNKWNSLQAYHRLWKWLIILRYSSNKNFSTQLHQYKAWCTSTAVNGVHSHLPYAVHKVQMSLKNLPDSFTTSINFWQKQLKSYLLKWIW